MNVIKRWTVDVVIGEHDGDTYAEARLRTEVSGRLVGTGRSVVSPDDFDVPEIGDEVAVGRALVNLGGQMLQTADGDIDSMTGRQPHFAS